MGLGRRCSRAWLDPAGEREMEVKLCGLIGGWTEDISLARRRRQWWMMPVVDMVHGREIWDVRERREREMSERQNDREVVEIWQPKTAVVAW